MIVRIIWLGIVVGMLVSIVPCPRVCCMSTKPLCRIGELEKDEDFWADDNDISYYGVEMELPGDWRVTKYPEGFAWTCCTGDGVSDGCMRGKHLEGDRNDDRSSGDSSEEGLERNSEAEKDGSSVDSGGDSELESEVEESELGPELPFGVGLRLGHQ